MSASVEPVTLHVDGDVATVTLNRPDVYNAIDDMLALELRRTLRCVAADTGVRAVILIGAGRAFCAGGDLRRFEALGAERPLEEVLYEVAGAFHDGILAIRRMSKAVIAALNGPTAGGGFSLALACDYRVASDEAFMQLAYTSHGLSIDGGGSFTLPRLVGLSTAMELALLDDRIDMARAHELGLVHEVVPAADLSSRAQALAERFSAMPVEIIGRTKRLFNQSYGVSLEEQLEAERVEISRAGAHPEGLEGIASFLEKRAPDYRFEL